MDTIVSIVIPSLNQAAYLEETIQSVLKQDYRSIEIIVMDGNSSDGSQDIIRKYERNIAIWKSEPDTGQSEAINKGFRLASGKIFAWLNSDDLIAPSAVKLAVSYLTSDPPIGLIYGDRVHIDQKGNIIGINRCPPFYNDMLSRNITIPQETAFFRREVFERTGGLDENLHFSMDYDLWCKFQRITKFRHVPAFMGFYREHVGSKSIVFSHENRSDPNKFLNEHQTVFMKHFQKKLPGPINAKFYRITHKLREQINRRSNAHRQDVQRIQSIIQDDQKS